MLSIHPTSAVLFEVVAAFNKRSKSLRYKGSTFNGERVIERNDGEEFEKLELAFQLRGARPPCMRLFIWSDRWVWIDARKPSDAGWVWQWSTEGRIAGADLGRRLLEAFEASVDSVTGDPVQIQSRLDGIWRPLVATGPSTVI